MSQAERHELDELRRQVYHSAGNAIYDSDHLLENFMESERENFQQRYDALSAKYKQVLMYGYLICWYSYLLKVFAS